MRISRKNDDRVKRNELLRRIAELEASHREVQEAQERLKRERDLSRTLIQASPAFFVAIGPDGKTILMNDAMLAALGYTQDEVAGKSYIETFVPERDRERLSRVFGRIIEAGEATLNENRVLTKGGDELIVEWHGRPVIDADGELEFFFGVGIDVTERRLAEKALNRKENEAQTYLDVVGVMLVAIGADERVRIINRKGCEILEASEDEIVGKNWFDTFLPSDVRERVRVHFRKLMKGGAPEALEYGENAVLTASGEERLIQWHNALLCDDDGTAAGILSSGIDITKTRRAEETQRVIYQIADAVHTTQDLDAFYARIHTELGRILNTRNFFIALYNEKTDTIAMPYFVDEKDQQSFPEFPAGKTLTAYVIRNDVPLLVTREEADQMGRKGLVEVIGSPSRIWLGVPLRVRGKVIGAVVLQNYSDPNTFDRKDLEILEFASAQIGISIERKRAEEKLRESEARNSAIIDAAPDLMFQIDSSGVFLSCDAPRGAQLAFTPERFLGKNVRELFDAAFADNVLKRLRRALASGSTEIFEYELAVPQPDGESRDFEARMVPSGRDSVLVVVRDITDHKRADRLLGALNKAALAMERTLSPHEIYEAAASELLRIGLKSTTLLCDGTGRNLVVEHCGHPSDARERSQRLLGGPLDGYSIPIDSSPLFEKVILNRETVYVSDNTTVITKILPDVPVENLREVVRGAAIRRSILAPLVVGETVIGAISVQSDTLSEQDEAAVTAFANQIAAAWRKATLMNELERSLEDLKNAQGQLLQAQKMEAVGRLAGGVAHDFNNLLTAITGYSQLVLGRLEPESQTHHDVEEIRKAADRAASLTSQLLAFSRRQPMVPSVADLNEVVANMDAMLERLIGEDIELCCLPSPDLSGVKIDIGQIEQVITNLVVNARDAMPEGGKLTIRTENVEIAEEECASIPKARPGTFVRLSIDDTGTGIDEAIVEQIFEPFFSTKGPSKGTGLGLAVVYGIVTQHDGWINVCSESGNGTSFKVYLPSSPIKARISEAATASFDGLEGQGERILLVEDEDTVRDFARAALDQNGYVVVEAAAACDALELFEKHNGDFQLIFSDVVLPDRSGIQLVEELMKKDPAVPVLLSSGYTDHKSQWPTIREKGIRFLQKPYSLPDLLLTVREVMGTDR